MQNANSTYFLILDTAKLQQQIETAKEFNLVYACLFEDKDAEELASVAPYLFIISNEAKFIWWYYKAGWSNSWGIILQAKVTLEKIITHLRRYVTIKQNGREYYFRFYDPRVFRNYLPTCNLEQLKAFFGPVELFICEDQDPNFALIFCIKEKSLKTERIYKEEVFNQFQLIS